MITDVMGEKRINPTYLIQGKEVAIISTFSDNIQYGIREHVKVLLITNEEKMLPEKMFLDRDLNTFVGRKVITTPLDANVNIIKVDKLACVTEMVISLDELDNTDNLEDRRLSNVLLRYLVTGSEEFKSFEPVTPSIRDLKMGVHFPNPENNGPKGQQYN